MAHTTQQKKNREEKFLSRFIGLDMIYKMNIETFQYLIILLEEKKMIVKVPKNCLDPLEFSATRW